MAAKHGGGLRIARCSRLLDERDLLSHAHGLAASRTAWGACRRRTSRQGPPLRAGQAHPPWGEISKISNELVASFQESRRGAPWPWWRVSAADEGGAVRKLRGTRWPRVRHNRHDPCTFYACTPEVCWLPMYAFPPHISIGWVGWQNLQPVKDKIRDWFASYYGCSMRIPLIC